MIQTNIPFLQTGWNHQVGCYFASRLFIFHLHLYDVFIVFWFQVISSLYRWLTFSLQWRNDQRWPPWKEFGEQRAVEQDLYIHRNLTNWCPENDGLEKVHYILPPWKLTYSLKINGWKMYSPMEIVPFLGHVSFQGSGLLKGTVLILQGRSEIVKFLTLSSHAC